MTTLKKLTIYGLILVLISAFCLFAVLNIKESEDNFFLEGLDKENAVEDILNPNTSPNNSEDILNPNTSPSNSNDKKVMAYQTGGTAVSSWALAMSELNNGRSCHLTNDITLGDNDVSEGQYLNYSRSIDGKGGKPTFFGNGKTITIATTNGKFGQKFNQGYNSSYENTKDNQSHGFLAADMSNINFRDVNVVLTSNVNLTSYFGQDASLYLTKVGIIAGQTNNVSFENVDVTINGSLNGFGKRNDGRGRLAFMLGGYVGAVTGNTSFNYCTLTVNGAIWSDSHNGAGGYWTNAQELDKEVAVSGGFIGEIMSSSTVTMTNITIKGGTNGVIGSTYWMATNNTSDNHGHSITGGIIGRIRSGAGSVTVNINGLNWDYNGILAVKRGGKYRMGAIIGNKYNNTSVNISNLFRKNNNIIKFYQTPTTEKYIQNVEGLAIDNKEEETGGIFNDPIDSNKNRICGLQTSPSSNRVTLGKQVSYKPTGSWNGGYDYGDVSVDFDPSNSDNVQLIHKMPINNDQMAIAGFRYGGGDDNALAEGRIKQNQTEYILSVEKNKVTQIVAETSWGQIPDITYGNEYTSTYNGAEYTNQNNLGSYPGRYTYKLPPNLVYYTTGAVNTVGSNTQFKTDKNAGKYNIEARKKDTYAKVEIGEVIAVERDLFPLAVVFKSAVNSNLGTATISPVTYTVTPDNMSKIYGDADPSFSKTITTSFGETLDITFVRAKGNDVAVYEFIDISHKAYPNYDIKLVTNNNKFSITKRDFEVSPTGTYSKVYGENDPSFLETKDSIYYGDKINVTFVRANGKDVGEYDFNGAVQNYKNYNLIFKANNNKFRIQKFTLTVTPTEINVIYGDKDPALTEVFGGKLGDRLAILYTREKIKTNDDVGKYDILTATLLPTDTNYNINNKNYDIILSDGNEKFVINKKPVAINALNSFEKIYGEKDPEFKKLLTGLFSNSFYVEFIRAAGESVGKYSFLTVVADNDHGKNYEPYLVDDVGLNKFEIKKKQIAVTVTQYETTYGNPLTLFEQNIDGVNNQSLGIKDTIKITYTLENGNAKNADFYNFRNFVINNANYEITVDTLVNKYEIKKKHLTISANQYSKTYGEKDPEFKQNVIGGFEEQIEIYFTRVKGEDCGTYNFSNIINNDINHTIDFATDGFKNRVTIAKKTVTISPKSQSFFYGDSLDNLSENFNFVNITTNDTITVKFSLSQSDKLNVGSYDLIISSYNHNNNYVVNFVAGANVQKVVILPKMLNFNPTKQIYKYKDTETEEILFYEEINGVYNGEYIEKVKVQLTRETGNTIGLYSFTKVSINDSNYTISCSDEDLIDKFEIVPFSINIQPNLFEKIFGKNDPDFTQEIAGRDGDNIKVIFVRASGEDVGTYDFESLTWDNDNYNIKFTINGNLNKFKINAKEIKIDWITNDFTYDETNQFNKVTASYLDINDIEISLNLSVENNLFLNYKEGGYTFTASFKNNETNYKLPDVKTNIYHIEKLNLTLGTPAYYGPTLYYGNPLPSIENFNFSKYGSYKLNENQTLLVNKTEYLYKFIATADALNNHIFANLEGSITLNVNKASPTFSVPTNLSSVYNTLLSSVELPKGFSWNDINATVGKVGTNVHIATYSPDDTTNYQIITNVTIGINVTKANYDMSNITFDDKTFDFDFTAKSLHISGNLPKGVTAIYDNNNIINAGEYIITVTFNGDYDNYNAIENKTAKLKINKIDYDLSHLSLDKSDKVYNGQFQIPDLIGQLPIGLDGIAVEFTVGEGIKDVGEKEIKFTFSSKSSNYKDVNLVLSKVLKIIPREINIASDKKYITSYLEKDNIVLIKNTHYIINNLVVGEDLDLIFNAKFINNEKEIEMNITSLNNRNYTIATTTVIIPALIDSTLTVIFSDLIHNYDNTVKNANILVEIGGVKTTSYRVEYIKNNQSTFAKNAGNYTVKLYILISGFENQVKENSLVIQKVAPNYSILGSNTIQYGNHNSQILAVSGKFNDGFYQNISLQYTFDGLYPKVGTYKTNAKFEGSENYLPFEEKDINLTVIKRELTIEYLGGRIVQYNGKLHTIDFKLHNTIDEEQDIITVGYEDDSMGINANEYSVIVKTIDSNYMIAQEIGTNKITIVKARLNVEIIADDKLIQGNAFEYKTSYSGFMEGEGINNITKVPELIGYTFNPGVHNIMLSGGEAKNYQFNYKPFVLNVYHLDLEETLGSSIIKVKGVFDPNADIQINSIKTDNFFKGFNNFSNLVTSAYSVKVINANDSKTYNIIMENMPATSFFNNVYYVDSQGNKTKLNKFIKNGVLNFTIQEEGSIIFVQNYNMLYLASIVIIALIVILAISIIISRNSVKRMKTRYNWIQY